MSEEKDPIASALNIALPIEEKVQLPAVSDPALVAANGDIDIAQENLKTLVRKGAEALDEIMEVASLSQHPRAYEVVAAMIGTLGELSKKMADIVKIKKETDTAGNPTSVTNQNLFVGSTAELMQILDKARNDRSS